jgi:hypothetical protein
MVLDVFSTPAMRALGIPAIECFLDEDGLPNPSVQEAISADIIAAEARTAPKLTRVMEQARLKEATKLAAAVWVDPNATPKQRNAAAWWFSEVDRRAAEKAARRHLKSVPDAHYVLVVCGRCGRQFKATRRSAKWCSRRCSNLAYRTRRESLTAPKTACPPVPPQIAVSGEYSPANTGGPEAVSYSRHPTVGGAR